LSISTSISAASLIEIFSGIRDVRLKEEKCREFRELLGCDELDPKTINETVALVIPRFQIEKIPEEVINESLDVESRKSFISDKAFFAFSDIQCANEILIGFKSQNLPLPQLTWDDEILEKWKKGKLQGLKALIVIGLWSNRFSTYYSKEHHELFQLETDPKDNLNGIIFKQWNGERYDFEVPDKEIIKYQEDSNGDYDYDYVLLAKTHIDSIKVFFVGGIRGQGTALGGKYLLDNWNNEEFLREDSNNHLKPNKNQFAMCVKLSNLDEDDRKIEYKTVIK
jgi:hypothetical protein